MILLGQVFDGSPRMPPYWALNGWGRADFIDMFLMVHYQCFEIRICILYF